MAKAAPIISIQRLTFTNRAELLAALAYFDRVGQQSDRPVPWETLVASLYYDRARISLAYAATPRGTKIVGCVTNLGHSAWPEDAPNFIEAVYVDGKYRRQGLARRLLQDSLEDMPHVQLFVEYENTAAQSLYHEMGFLITSTIWHAGTLGKRLVTMTRRARPRRTPQ